MQPATIVISAVLRLKIKLIDNNIKFCCPLIGQYGTNVVIDNVLGNLFHFVDVCYLLSSGGKHKQ